MINFYEFSQNQEAFDEKKDADGNITKAQFEEQAANNTDTKVGQ